MYIISHIIYSPQYSRGSSLNKLFIVDSNTGLLAKHEYIPVHKYINKINIDKKRYISTHVNKQIVR